MRTFPRISSVFITGILLFSAGCNKSKAAREAAALVKPDGAPALDLSTHPQLLFQVYGDQKDPRVMPIGAVVNGAIHAIGLSDQGWHALDSMYFAPGTKYITYSEAEESGDVTIRRRMWAEDGRALYPLPGCQSLRPLAAAIVTLRTPSDDPYLEFVASSVPLAKRAPYTGKLPTDAELAKIGRDFGHTVGKTAKMDNAELDSLDFHARAVITGAAAEPTLLVSFIDPTAGDLGPGAGHTSHLFALGENTGSGYKVSYRHAVSGDAKTVEFQRLIDHVDVNGDGIDEIILEAWRYGGQTDLVVLSFRNGGWHEALRVPMHWCMDTAKR